MDQMHPKHVQSVLFLSSPDIQLNLHYENWPKVGVWWLRPVFYVVSFKFTGYILITIRW